MPLRRAVAGHSASEQRLRRVVEDVLVGAGFSEAYTWSLVASDPDPDAIRLPDPMSGEQAILRTTLRRRPRRGGRARTSTPGTTAIALFELARVYLPIGRAAAGGALARRRHRRGRLRAARAAPSRCSTTRSTSSSASERRTAPVPPSRQGGATPSPGGSASCTRRSSRAPGGSSSSTSTTLIGADPRADPLRRRDHLPAAAAGHRRGRRRTRSRRRRSSTRSSRRARPELREARVFDVYRGDQVGEGRKSVAHPPLAPGARPDAVGRRRGGRARAGRGRARGAVRRGATSVGTRREAEASHSILPPTSHTGPWVATMSVSESTRSTRVTPSIPSASRRSKQRRAIARRDAVARAGRAAEDERRPRAGAGRVQRRAEERRPVEERARHDLDLAEQVASSRTGARASAASQRLGDRSHVALPASRRLSDASAPATFETLELAPRALVGRAAGRGAAAFWALFAPARLTSKTSAGPTSPGVDRAEHLGGAGQVARLLGRQRQPDLHQSVRQAVLDRAPLIDELHRAISIMTGMNAVVKSRTSRGAAGGDRGQAAASRPGDGVGHDRAVAQVRGRDASRSASRCTSSTPTR